MAFALLVIWPALGCQGLGDLQNTQQILGLLDKTAGTKPEMTRTAVATGSDAKKSRTGTQAGNSEADPKKEADRKKVEGVSDPGGDNAGDPKGKDDDKGGEPKEGDADDDEADIKQAKEGAGKADTPLPPGARKVERQLNKPPFSEHFRRKHPWWDDEDDDEPESWPNSQSPGPDMANFPNSAFTVPRGAFQVEFAPFALNGPSDDAGSTYSTQFLLRYGLTDHLEFRIFGLGFTAILSGPQRTTGFSPIAFDLKMNLWDESDNHIIPAVGLEAYIQTIYGSPIYRSGTQPSLSLLFDHTLPLGINFEWNVGFNGAQAQLIDRGDVNGPINIVHHQLETDVLEFNLQWALQRRFFEKLDIFTHGFLNSAAIPNLGDGLVVGGGAIWMATHKLTFFGSCNAGLNRNASSTSVILGGAWAF